nr:probable envelope ADP,ATP carrier protein, chloroplastic [Tanacetum cinerariifolium]
GEGSGTPTEPHHTPSPEADPSHPTTSSIPLPFLSTAFIPPVTQTYTTPIKQYSRRTRIAQSSAFPTVADEPASPVRDVSEGDACPTESGFIADQDRATIAKFSTLPHDSVSRVTSPAADEGSMQHTISELTALCTSLQRQHSKLMAKFQAQEEEIVKLKERVQVLEDRESDAAKQSGDDAPIKGISINEGEATAKRISNDSEEIARVLTSMDAATVLAGGTNVPTGSGSIPTAGPPATVISTGSKVGPTASVIVTSYSRRKGKEVMERIVGNKIHKAFPLPEKMKEMMQLVPVEDVYIQALQVKHPIIDWKSYTKVVHFAITPLKHHTLSSRKFPNKPKASTLTTFVAASIATLTCYPLDTFRRQMQMRSTPYMTIFDAFLAGLYRGFVPNVLKTLKNNSIKLTTFDSMKRLILAIPREEGQCGNFASIFATTGISDLEQKTFTRLEASTNGSLKKHGDEGGNLHAAIFMPMVTSRVLEKENASPAQLAKAYMGSRPSKGAEQNKDLNMHGSGSVSGYANVPLKVHPDHASQKLLLMNESEPKIVKGAEQNRDTSMNGLGSANVPLKSNQTATKILQHIENMVLKEKSSGSTKSPTKWTIDMLHRQALGQHYTFPRVLETPESVKVATMSTVKAVFCLLLSANNKHHERLHDSQELTSKALAVTINDPPLKLPVEPPHKKSAFQMSVPVSDSFEIDDDDTQVNGHVSFLLVECNKQEITLAVDIVTTSTLMGVSRTPALVEPPQKKCTFQMSAPEDDSYEIDDDDDETQVNGHMSLLLVESNKQETDLAADIVATSTLSGVSRTSV